MIWIDQTAVGTATKAEKATMPARWPSFAAGDRAERGIAQRSFTTFP
jgi:hypothetical protein